MAANAGPIYGKQYIRYAETWNAPLNAEAGSPAAVTAGTVEGIVEVGELHAVAYSIATGPNYAAEPQFLAPANWTGKIVGINQAYMPTALASPASARQLTVATSGLLLIVVDPTIVAPAFVLNSQLRLNTLGEAVDAGGTLATLDGTTPLIREYVEIGGRKLVLVSFA